MIYNPVGKLVTMDILSYLNHPFEIVKEFNYLCTTFSARGSSEYKAMYKNGLEFGLGVPASVNLFIQPIVLSGSEVWGHFLIISSTLLQKTLIFPVNTDNINQFIIPFWNYLSQL